MKKQHLILGIAFIFILAFALQVKASLTDGLIAYYSFEGNAEDNTSNNFDGSISGATSSQGILGKGYTYDGNDVISVTNNGNLTTPYLKTVVCFFNLTSIDSNINAIASVWDTGASGRWGLYASTTTYDGKNTIGGDEEIGTLWKGIENIVTGKWYMIAMTWQTTTSPYNVTMWLNSTPYNYGTTASLNTAVKKTPLAFGAFSYSPFTNYLEGSIDECALYNRTLSEAELLEYETNIRSGIGYPFITGEPAGTQPSVTLYSDLRNGTVTNLSIIPIYFNATSVNNSNIYTCDAFIGSYMIDTKASIDLSTQQYLTYDIDFLAPITEDWYNLTLNCFNENASSNLSALYYIDTNKSVLNYLAPNGTYYNDVPLYVNLSVTDENLYSIEYLAYQGTTLKQNITMVGSIGGTYNIYNLSAVSQITGFYTWKLNVWENHNPLSSADLFTEFTTTKDKDLGILTYSDKDKSYSITSKEKLDVKTETKNLKQYFEFIPDAKAVKPKFYTYYFSYDGDLRYLPNTQYKGHFLLWDVKRYVDFQCNDYVNVFKETDHLYRIETPCTKFETTGNLNFMSWEGNFTITTPPSLSDDYLLSLNQSINDNLNDIKEELKMYNIAIPLLLIGLFFVVFVTANSLKSETSGIVNLMKLTLYAFAVFIIWAMVQTLYSFALEGDVAISAIQPLFQVATAILLIIGSLLSIYIIAATFIWLKAKIKAAYSGRQR